MSYNVTYCGFIAIIGRSNVGKSTLLNKLLGHKVSITSSKPQTTRHRILGIHTEGQYQSIYIDTPGINIKYKHPINRIMNRTATNTISSGSVDLVIFVAECTQWTIEDDMIINQLNNLNTPVLLVINKVDLVIYKNKLLPYIEFLCQKIDFYEVIPICAATGMNLSIIVKIVHKLLPISIHHFPVNCITDSSPRFIASEIIREKLMRFLGKELPYLIAVDIESIFTNKDGEYNIRSLIIVERHNQKKIVIGNNGSKIKTIGIEARHDMEVLFATRVHLSLWVVVKSSGWTDNNQSLRKMN